MEGTRAATSSPSGRMVLRAEEAASSGPPWPNILKQESYSRVDHDQVWRNGRQKQSYRQKGRECVQEVIEAVLPSEMVIKAMNYKASTYTLYLYILFNNCKMTRKQQTEDYKRNVSIVRNICIIMQIENASVRRWSTEQRR